ncbi:MAG: DHA2 family efflux MFS transporter permease subunit [Actinobacteria bacterium]|nr:MAG: DHA2 family efflux MFS transporter permease subunit [Actinomycetota bacterium]
MNDATEDRPSKVQAAPAEASRALSDHPWWALSALLIGLSMIVIDGSVVNVLLPDMVDDLQLTTTDVLWVNSIYSLIFASLLIPIGLISDKYGRRKLFLIGTVVFMLGSFGAGASTGPDMLIALRAVQAIGASMMLPSSVAIINVMFTGKQRAMAFGLWGAVFGGAAALGPLLGGWLAQDYSWRWAFYINVPVAILSSILVWRYVPESKVDSGDSLDPVGIVLSVTGLSLVVFALIEGDSYGWWNQLRPFTAGPIKLEGHLSIVPIALGLGVLLLILLVLWAKHRMAVGKTPLIDLPLFAIPRYGYGNIVALVVSLGEFGILFMLPLWIQSVAGYNPLNTGIILTGLALGALVSGGMARHLAALLGPTKVVRVGMALEIVGILGTAMVLAPTRSPWWLMGPLFVYGIGLGLASAQLTSVVLEDVPPDKSGRASAMTSTFRQLGSALGSAILGSVLFAGLGHFMTVDLKGVSNLPEAQQQQIVDTVKGSSGQAIPKLAKVPGLGPEVEAARSGYTTAAKDTAYVAALFVLMGLLVSFGLPKDEQANADASAVDELAAQPS